MAKDLVQGSRQHRTYQFAGYGLGLAALLYVPYFAGEGFRIDQYSECLAYAVAILGLNMVIGFSGQLSLGHSAFVGIGAYTTIILNADHGWSFFATIPVSAVLCFAVGMVLGLPALRIKGLYLAVVTLSVGVVFPTLILKYESLTGGPNGKKSNSELVPPDWTWFNARDREDPRIYTYYVLLVLAVIMFVLGRNILRSRFGRAVIAIRDNQTSAAVMGVNLQLYKTLIFGVSAAFAGVAGSMFVIEKPFVSDTRFGLNLAIFMIVGLVAGGIATIPGAIPGSLLVVFVPWYTSEWSKDVPWLKDRPGSGAVANVIYGVLLILLVFVLPGGIVDGFRRIRARFVRVIPNPKWLAAARAKAADAPALHVSKEATAVS